MIQDTVHSAQKWPAVNFFLERLYLFCLQSRGSQKQVVPSPLKGNGQYLLSYYQCIFTTNPMDLTKVLIPLFPCLFLKQTEIPSKLHKSTKLSIYLNYIILSQVYDIYSTLASRFGLKVTCTVESGVNCEQSNIYFFIQIQ